MIILREDDWYKWGAKIFHSTCNISYCKDPTAVIQLNALEYLFFIYFNFLNLNLFSYLNYIKSLNYQKELRQLQVFQL